MGPTKSIEGNARTIMAPNFSLNQGVSIDWVAKEPMATRASVIAAMRRQGSTWKQIGNAIGISDPRWVAEIEQQYLRHLRKMEWFLERQSPLEDHDFRRLVYGMQHGKFELHNVKLSGPQRPEQEHADGKE